ncbi:DNA mismatch repair protein MLH3 isoform X2 [Rhodamnia argentea]|uniref:DNA mismatch repair protein MLH3 isoform X2 n=1 Tax=Rhodamnia argentea TaxID=178133 RepID=A0A8B8N0U0_9MYRT|nr:DNA mismatch repair protein MLH3 isoform X2 [Rhodamnia argentea]
MSEVKPLSHTVHSSMRSGVVLFDLTSVVEELVFNSVDAGAKKVSVFVGISNCFVKVVDDGSGITRDGLVLLGERYATSKDRQLDDIDSCSGSFGSRGEALASISDIAVLEITTKAPGKPNGYRKVLKGCKCLHLGIDDDRKDAGTSVVVRDVFYNQPIRRKSIQSSPKKVLESIKKSVFHTAIVHSEISFQVVDIESDDQLLCTRASTTPLSTLRSFFGNEVVSILHEFNAREGALELTGYLSGPCEAFAIKAFQYVYINSRFVCKSPIHKLVNQLAKKFEHVNARRDGGLQKSKRSRSCAGPAYILKLSCPRSLYDLSFEPSKTFVQFKDWVAILACIEKEIQLFWKVNSSRAMCSRQNFDTLGKDLEFEEDQKSLSGKPVGDYSELARKKRRFSEEGVLNLPSFLLEMPGKESHHNRKVDEGENPFRKIRHKGVDFTAQQNEIDSLLQDSYFVPQSDNSLSGHFSSVISKDDDYQWSPDNRIQHTQNDISYAEDETLVKCFSLEERSENILGGDIFTSMSENESFDNDPLGCNGAKMSLVSSVILEGSDKFEVGSGRKRPCLQSCSSRDNLRSSPLKFTSSEGFEFESDIFQIKQKQSSLYDDPNFRKHNHSKQSFGSFSGALWPDEVCSDVQPVPKYTAKEGKPVDTDCPFAASYRSVPRCTDSFIKEAGLSSRDFFQKQNPGSGCWSSDFDWFSDILRPSRQAKPSSGKQSIDNFVLETSSECHKRASYMSPFNEGKNVDTYDCFSKSPGDKMSTTIDMTAECGIENNINLSIDPRKPKASSSLKTLSKPYDILADERAQLCQELCHDHYEATRDYAIQTKPIWDNDAQQKNVHGERSRSRSAPPFCRKRRSFISLYHLSLVNPENSDAKTYHASKAYPEAGEPKYSQLSSSLCHLSSRKDSVELPFCGNRIDIDKLHDNELKIKELHKAIISGSVQDSRDYGTKWRDSCLQKKCGSSEILDQTHVLDIASGFLHLAGDSLVPTSISRNCLVNARVLQQVDKKFIPVVAGGTLAVIDQHAADERIRLEELRRKVLSGEAKTISYLESEKELVLPEIGCQLLLNYGEQIKDWGWICTINAQGSRDINLLQRQPTVVTLLAVPCILGVDLNDVDLLEYLQQLADTDGASTMPPAVLRVLNFKACRGAIMFGDSLLLSECSLIVEGLKGTSLCFQCAHGRPTTVPLVDLEALHKQVNRLCLPNDGPNDLWHGLRRCEVSLERAVKRLDVASR